MKKRIMFSVLFFVLIFTSVCVLGDNINFLPSGLGVSFGGVGGSSFGPFSGTPAAVVTPTASGGGGGGGGGAGAIGLAPVPNLVINPSSFNLPASVGITSSGEVVVTNNGTENISLVITLGNLGGIIVFNQTNITLLPEESKTLSFLVDPPSEAGIYSGKIYFSSLNYQTAIPLILNVGQGQSLFDIFIKIPGNYRTIQQGENLVTNISLIQKGAPKETDVVAQYTVQDFDGNVYSTGMDTFAVLDKKDYSEVFNTSSLLPGNYLVGVKIIYSGGIATASSTFTVVPVGGAQAPKGGVLNNIFGGISSFAGKIFSSVGKFFSNASSSAKVLLGKVGAALVWLHVKVILIVAAIVVGVIGLLIGIIVVAKNFFAWKSRYKIWKYSR